ncbi:MAG: CRISPR-associated endonuclease Cas2 [Lentisphaerae bacterium]|nr:CRISPR-associated endonuclease Cas2 [Lentisphaerota bacterium]
MMVVECLAVYDIADPKRLRLVARIMESFGIRVQKSVFECHLPQSALKRMLSCVQGVMDAEVDSLRVYPLPANSRAQQIILGCGEIPAFPPAFVI